MLAPLVAAATAARDDEQPAEPPAAHDDGSDDGDGSEEAGEEAGPKRPGDQTAIQWAQGLLDSITKAGVGEALAPMAPAFESLFGSANVVSSFLLTNRLVDIDGTRVAIKSTRGDDRVEAVRIFGDELMEASTATLDGQVVMSVLLQLLSVLCPEPASASSMGGPPPGMTTRSGNSPQGFRLLSEQIATEQDKIDLKRRQMPQEELLHRTKALGKRNLDLGPKQGDMPHLQQMRGLVQAIENDKVIPSAATLQPTKMCDAGDLAKKVDKDQDFEASTTTNLLVVRQRCTRYAHGVGAAAARTADGPETYRGAVAFARAIDAAVNIVSVPALEAVIEEALAEAQSVRNGDFEAPKSLGAAYQAAAKCVRSCNSTLRVDALRTKRTRDDDDAGTGGKGGGGGGGGGGDGGKGDGGGGDKPRRKKLKDTNGVMQWFGAKAGGNDTCATECRDKKCKKNSKCLYSHVSK